MAQGSLPFKYESETTSNGMTALAGLPVYLDLAHVAGLQKSIEEHLQVRNGGQGWTDSQMILSLVMLNLAGGDCVDDIKKLESDEGFCEILKKVELHGLKRPERRELLRRWRKEKNRSIPSASSIFRYLSCFHDEAQEELRKPGKAFIPENNEHLTGFAHINKDLVAFLSTQQSETVATLDQDATLVETNKANAKYCYKGFKAYQPLNTWWAEMGIILHTEFRDGNVPAGFEQLRVFQESLKCLPDHIKKVRLRSDTAGYQHNLLKYCATGENERFGVIEFAIGCNVSAEFKEAVAQVESSEWKPLYKTIGDKKIKTKTEWAEVCYVPNAIGHSKNGPEYRYIAKREILNAQKELPGMTEQMEFPFPTMDVDDHSYKVFGIVTNMDWEGGKLIHWLHERCGKSEEAHAVMKDDLAGGKLPSDDFGENAAWWWSMILALNLNAIMKKLVLAKSWTNKRMKAVRFNIINLPGRVLDRSRTLIIRLNGKNPAIELLINARRRIAMLERAPCG
ncbi:MAG: IS1380 family transposase [Desulfobacterales bacterium]|nr:IS1380 family transposase [Desulfobacterales bacterium]